MDASRANRGIQQAVSCGHKCKDRSCGVPIAGYTRLPVVCIPPEVVGSQAYPGVVVRIREHPVHVIPRIDKIQTSGIYSNIISIG